MAQLRHLAAGERGRNPIPPRIADLVRDVLDRLAPAGAATLARLDALTPALRAARNMCATRRHFTRVVAALGAGGVSHVVPGDSMAAMHAALLCAANLASAAPGVERGIVLLRDLRLMGKKGGLRLAAPFLEVTPHALGRFVQRSGREDAAALNAAISDAGRHAQALLPALCGPAALWRLEGSGAPILLPTAGGAFLGFCRVGRLAGRRQPVPLVEAATWLHGFDLAEPQQRLAHALEQAAPQAALERALLALSPPLGGDRRAGSFAFAPLASPPDVQDQLTLAASPALLAPRLSRGELSPEEAWREVRGVLSLR
ncbi:hypothetical protein ACI6QG_00600 [Roseococcus sp. DSY-14]|uniref:hypothetical protein n=1 Tax=Roseococcus sp. DSY-14 TaxID=3369650 RepID=UPI00387AC46B